MHGCICIKPYENTCKGTFHNHYSQYTVRGEVFQTNSFTA